mmetsp:Transcript_14225/g.24315  ORF Transcript_14225/g.24315 Transcript_14225/m.24315 type:complete len:463 (+) Transcript_14225:67-1455(+)
MKELPQLASGKIDPTLGPTGGVKRNNPKVTRASRKTHSAILCVLMFMFWHGFNLLSLVQLQVKDCKDDHNYFAAPSFFSKALTSCVSAKERNGRYPSDINVKQTRGHPPTLYREIAVARVKRWYHLKEERNYLVDFLRMIEDKLGGYLYALRCGVRTPRVLFCGRAKDLPRNFTLKWEKFVLKPLKGAADRGVRVVRNGKDILADRELDFDEIVAEHMEEPMIVEELIESAHQNYHKLIPPDYKFHVFGGRPEIMWFVDRNKGQKCKDYFYASSEGYWYVDSFRSEDLSIGLCPNRGEGQLRHLLNTGRMKDMALAVASLTGKMSYDWMRIDMFDSSHGPVLGEFTPSSSMGQTHPLESCVMSYLFLIHAEHGKATDDVATLKLMKERNITEANNTEVKKSLLEMSKLTSFFSDQYSHDSHGDMELGVSPEEVHRWNGYSAIEKCEKVMEAQKDMKDSHVGS